jgi:hypothetical protein
MTDPKMDFTMTDYFPAKKRYFRPFDMFVVIVLAGIICGQVYIYHSKTTLTPVPAEAVQAPGAQAAVAPTTVAAPVLAKAEVVRIHPVASHRPAVARHHAHHSTHLVSVHRGHHVASSHHRQHHAKKGGHLDPGYQMPDGDFVQDLPPADREESVIDEAGET